MTGIDSEKEGMIEMKPMGRSDKTMSCKAFACGVLLGMTAAMTALPMADPIIRGRMVRCGRRMMKKAKSGIENLI